MSTFWIRSATLQIGPFKYSLEDLDFSFEVPFWDSEELSTATITVTNLSPATRASLKKNHIVILNAGYESGIGMIFLGQIAGLTHQHSGTEWRTKIIATEVTTEWLSTQVNKTYTRAITAQEIVEDLLNIFGLEVAQVELARNIEYPRGRVCKGLVKDVLQEIVMGECKSRLLIRHGQVIINNPEDGTNLGFLLSPATGLLQHQEDTEIVAIETALTEEDSLEEKDEAAQTWTRQCLLNYQLGPSDIIMIQSRSLNGRFQIVQGKHSGSPTGQWITEIEVRSI